MKKGRIILLAATAAFIAGTLLFLFGRPQGVYYQHRELKRRAVEIAAHRKTIDSLTDVITKLTNDTTYIERIAREKLGMARKNETVYKFIEKRK